MRHQLIEPARGLRRKERQDVFHVGIRVVPVELRRLDETHHCGQR